MTETKSGERARGRVAAIDFGTRRIGIAICDANRTIASPYENYDRGSPDQDAVRFRQLANEEGIVLFVVGLPLHMSGDESQKSREARAFGEWLHAATEVPVEYFDERFSSKEADELLHLAGATRKKRKTRRDMLAAQVILASYLAAQSG